jgi:hypothetical protein
MIGPGAGIREAPELRVPPDQLLDALPGFLPNLAEGDLADDPVAEVVPRQGLRGRSARSSRLIRRANPRPLSLALSVVTGSESSKRQVTLAANIAIAELLYALGSADGAGYPATAMMRRRAGAGAASTCSTAIAKPGTSTVVPELSTRARRFQVVERAQSVSRCTQLGQHQRMHAPRGSRSSSSAESSAGYRRVCITDTPSPDPASLGSRQTCARWPSRQAARRVRRLLALETPGCR